MERLSRWYDDINAAQSDVKYDFVFVDQEGFENYQPKNFGALVSDFRGYHG